MTYLDRLNGSREAVQKEVLAGLAREQEAARLLREQTIAEYLKEQATVQTREQQLRQEGRDALLREQTAAQEKAATLALQAQQQAAAEVKAKSDQQFEAHAANAFHFGVQQAAQRVPADGEPTVGAVISSMYASKAETDARNSELAEILRQEAAMQPKERIASRSQRLDIPGLVGIMSQNRAVAGDAPQLDVVEFPKPEPQPVVVATAPARRGRLQFWK